MVLLCLLSKHPHMSTHAFRALGNQDKGIQLQLRHDVSRALYGQHLVVLTFIFHTVLLPQDYERGMLLDTVSHVFLKYTSHVMGFEFPKFLQVYVQAMASPRSCQVRGNAQQCISPSEKWQLTFLLWRWDCPKREFWKWAWSTMLVKLGHKAPPSNVHIGHWLHTSSQRTS